MTVGKEAGGESARKGVYCQFKIMQGGNEMYKETDQTEERKPESRACSCSCTAASDPQEDTAGPCLLSDCASFLIACCYSTTRPTVWLTKARVNTKKASIRTHSWPS